jgi:hypothetical protein
MYELVGKANHCRVSADGGPGIDALSTLDRGVLPDPKEMAVFRSSAVVEWTRKSRLVPVGLGVVRGRGHRRSSGGSSTNG